MLSKTSLDLSPLFQAYKTKAFFRTLKSKLFAGVKTMLSKSSWNLSLMFQNSKAQLFFKTLKRSLFLVLSLVSALGSSLILADEDKSPWTGIVNRIQPEGKSIINFLKKC